MAVKLRKSGAWVDVGVAATSGTTKVAVLWDQRSADTDGGTFTQDAWQDRVLNSKTDPKSIVSWPDGASTGTDGTNTYFSLESGTYLIEWSAPAVSVSLHKTQLLYANNSSFTSSTAVQGTSSLDASGIDPNSDTRSFGETVLTVTEKTYFKIQHQCTVTQPTYGFGYATDIGTVEVYTQVRIEDLATAVKDNVVAGNTKVATVKDVKAYNENGGGFAAAEWVHRDLNTLSDPQNIGLSVSGNVVTVPAGTYSMRWRAPGYWCNSFTSRLAYSTTSSTVASGITYVDGTTGYDQAGDDGGLSITQTYGDIGSITFTSTTYLKIEQYSATGYIGPGTGLGGASNIVGVDSVYTTLVIQDLATAVKDNVVGGTSKVAVIEHREDSSVGDLPAFTQNAWVTRELTDKVDPNGMVTFPVATDSATDKTQFSLEAGSYRIKWGAPAVRCDRHQSKLVYATNSSFTSPTTVYGSSEIIENGENLVGTRSLGETVLTLTETTWFKIQQIVDGPATGVAASSKGFNTAAVFSAVTDPPTYSIYTQVSIEDLATAVKSTSDTSSSGGSYNNIQVLTSGTTYTPTSGMKSCVVHCTGGGGAGGGQHNESNRFGVGGHGGAGGTAIRSYTAAEMGATATISIGSGGTTNGTSAGNAGSNTTFTPAGSGTALTGGGGSGGSAFAVNTSTYEQTPATNGAGGSASGGMWNITGREAENSFTATHYDSDTGDNPPCGSGGNHTHNGPVVSVRAHPAESALSMMGPDYGRGGLGSIVFQAPGTAGKAGAIVVYEWT